MVEDDLCEAVSQSILHVRYSAWWLPPPYRSWSRPSAYFPSRPSSVCTGLGMAFKIPFKLPAPAPSWHHDPLHESRKKSTSGVSSSSARLRRILQIPRRGPTVPRRARTYPQRVSSPLCSSDASRNKQPVAARTRLHGSSEPQRHVTEDIIHRAGGEPRRRRRDHRQSTLYPQRGAVLDLLCCCW